MRIRVKVRSKASIRLLFGVSDVVAKDEAEFKYATELVRIRSCFAKNITLCEVLCVHKPKIAAKIHAAFLVGRRRSKSGSRAARSKPQKVDRSIGCSPGTCEVFKAHGN